MVQGNESLLQAVTHTLRLLEKQLQKNQIKDYQKEWDQLTSLVHQAQHAVVDGEGIDKKAIVKAMMVITNQIDAEVIHLEHELHGVQNFASLSSTQVTVITLKQHIKEELNRLIQLVASARVRARHSDFSDIIDMLRPEQV